MSNLERDPVESVSGPEPTHAAAIQVLAPRDVPLGGPRAMRVRRTLPQRGRTTIGAWCFVDHYGPDDVAASGGMLVPPHPHTGLQTVSWLFEGEIEHRDSTGSAEFVRPGAVNLMTAGRGIAHSEVSTPATTRLHGVQLWIALPDASRGIAPFFEHAQVEPVIVDDAEVRVFAGSLPGVEASDGLDQEGAVTVFSPLVGAQVELPAGGEAWIELDPAFEHGLLVDLGPLTATIPALDDEPDDARPDADPLAVAGHTTGLARGELGYIGVGHEGVRLRAGADAPARAVLIGGTPFGEELVMWWNFIGRDHDEIAEFRRQWQADVIAAGDADGRFGTVDGFDGAPLPAPELPTVRLKPRS
ncbi:pirin family protein [Agromyces terreus]|uniref:pirin family protein n=1 Tax=Agromyces terreus TaxID=424795 RepID=UPI0031D919F8